MGGRLVYHDLIEISRGRMLPICIYWLRLFDKGDEYVAVVTNVPGNRGLLLANPEIARYIIERWEVRPTELTLYRIFPKIHEWSETKFEQVTIDFSKELPKPRYKAVTRKDIVNHVGSSLPELPVHEDLYRRVLERGGGDERWAYWNYRGDG